MTTPLEVACFGFVIGIVGAIALLLLWSMLKQRWRPSGLHGALELTCAWGGAAVGIGGVAYHLSPPAALAGLSVLLLLLVGDTVLTVRAWRRHR